MASGSPSDSPSKSPSPLISSSATKQGIPGGHIRRGSRTSHPSSPPPRSSRSRSRSRSQSQTRPDETTQYLSLDKTLWRLHIPLHITHVSQPTAPFITSVPRFGYLALLLPRLTTYYGSPCSSFHHEGVQLRNLAVGLLVDLYQPSLPWKLAVGDGPEWDIGDTFMNSAKEVCLSTPLAPNNTMVLTTTPPGRLHPQRQRQTNHVPQQRPHHRPMECRPRQRLRLLHANKQPPAQRLLHRPEKYPPAHLHPVVVFTTKHHR